MVVNGAESVAKILCLKHGNNFKTEVIEVLKTKVEEIEISIEKMLKMDYEKAEKTINRAAKQVVDGIKGKNIRCKTSHVACIDGKLTQLVQTMKSILSQNEAWGY